MRRKNKRMRRKNSTCIVEKNLSIRWKIRSSHNENPLIILFKMKILVEVVVEMVTKEEVVKTLSFIKRM